MSGGRQTSLFLLALAACSVPYGQLPGNEDSGSPTDSDPSLDPDADGDGYAASVDCEDDDPTIHPGATESCDGLDQDCDGTPDDDAIDATDWYPDADRDGAGDPASTTRACASPADHVADAGDCDDAEPSAHPGAPEVCGDGLDNGCDGDDDCLLSGDVGVGDADLQLHGLAEKDFAGSAAWAGDIDGDGSADVLTGAYGYDPGGATDSGRVYVHYGPFTGAESLLAPGATVTGGAYLDDLGWAAVAGDLDGDGLGEIAIGAAGADDGGNADAGAVYIFAGAPTGDFDEDEADCMIHGDDADDQAGFALATLTTPVGGFVLVGAPLSKLGGDTSGAVGIFVLRAASFQFSDGAEALLVGLGEGALAGYAVASGDLDGDGVGDAVVGAPQAEWGGSASVFFGPLSGSIGLDVADAALTAEGGAEDAFGGALAVCDLDVDGLDDLLVGADHADHQGVNAGSAYVFTSLPSGSGTGADASMAVHGAGEGDYVGRSLACAGDVNADGNADLLVGATGLDAYGVTGAGAALLYFGPLSGSHSAYQPNATLGGSAASDAMGHRTAGADLNGDGISDVISTAMGRDQGGLNAGGLFAWFGASE